MRGFEHFLKSLNRRFSAAEIMDLELLDKVALVTGGSRGLGFASAAALVREGCRVTICARGEAKLQEAAATLRSVAPQGGGDPVQAVAADLSTPEGIASVVSRTLERFSSLDILVNNVGLAKGSGIVETS